MKVCCRCGSLCSEQGHSSSSSINTWDYLGLTLILRSFDTYHSGSTVLGSSRFNFEHACCKVFGIAQIPVVSILGTSPRLRASSFCRLIFFSSWLARPTWCRAMSPKGTLFSQQNVFIFVCKGPKGTQCLINCLIFCDSDIIIIIILLLLVVVLLLLWLWLLLLFYYIYILFIYGMIILLVLAKLHKAIGSSPSPCGSAFSWSCGHSQIRRCTCAVYLLVPPTQWLRQSGQLSQMPVQPQPQYHNVPQSEMPRQVFFSNGGFLKLGIPQNHGFQIWY